MRITKRQLRRIIREAIDPREMEEPLGGYVGNALHNDPDYKHHTDNKPFKIPYKNYGYEGRTIHPRDRAWLEFVPKGSPPMTREDMFRAVTLLDSDDQEIGLAMATTHAPKFDRRHLENYDVYSIYATTTG